MISKAIVKEVLQTGLQRTWDMGLRAKQRLRPPGDIERFPPPRKLHLGCGTVHLDGWVNVDADSGWAVDFVWDLRLGIPGQAESASFIYCEHFLEHLAAHDGLMFMRECRRVLVPGGVVRIAMPSLDFILDRAVSDNWRDQEWLRAPRYQSVQTRAEMLNLVFREWGHRWLYDREELDRRLREAGFLDLTFCERNVSAHPELQNLETRPDSILVCEARKD